jgi:hypothetical protein
MFCFDYVFRFQLRCVSHLLFKGRVDLRLHQAGSQKIVVGVCCLEIFRDGLNSVLVNVVVRKRSLLTRIR